MAETKVTGDDWKSTWEEPGHDRPVLVRFAGDTYAIARFTPDGLRADHTGKLLGGVATHWTEFIPRPKQSPT